MPAPTSFPSHLKLDTDTQSPGVMPGPRPWNGDANLIYQVTKGALHQDTYLLLQPLLKQSQKIQVMFHCISHPATGTEHVVEGAEGPQEVPAARWNLHCQPTGSPCTTLTLVTIPML